MKNSALELHQLFNQQKRYRFPFDKFINEIPKNGIYIIFERGEKYSDFDRIVRVGTHTGINQLRSRLNQHFVKENKNRSIFRKNIGRCFLNKENNIYLNLWELDNTSKVDKAKNLALLDSFFEKELEKKITKYIQTNLSFCVFQIDTKEDRLFWESKIISTLANASNIKASAKWLGNYSTKDKIKVSGLWQVNELYNVAITETELAQLKEKLHTPNNFVSKYFEPEPNQWGLRGDSHLWREMKQKTARTNIPMKVDEFEKLLFNLFKEFTGESPQKGKNIYLKKYDTGGMSKGMINSDFWLENGFSLLIQRYNQSELQLIAK